jgi:hypothetical protein
MGTLLRIKELTPGDVRLVIRDSINPLDAGRIADFVASVDWSTCESADPEVVRLLGQAEALTTEYGEDDIGQDDLVRALEALVAVRASGR